MNTNSENTRNPPVINEFGLVVTVIKIVILAIFLVPLARYTIDRKSDGIEKNVTEAVPLENISAVYTTLEVVQNASTEMEPEVAAIVLPKQPSCPKSKLVVVLKELCEELLTKREFCVPEDVFNKDKHKIPIYNAKNNSTKEAKVPTIVNYALGGLLMTSLGAALIELYRAKKQPTKKNGKHPLSRKCSLADLTVLKHQRKELTRRESLMEVPEESLYYSRQIMDPRPPPLQRRSSFPIQPVAFQFSTYGILPSSNQRLSNGSQTSLSNNIRRQSTVLDSRRQSSTIDSQRSSVDLGGVSMEGSPERRHRCRLMNRH